MVSDELYCLASRNYITHLSRIHTESLGRWCFIRAEQLNSEHEITVLKIYFKSQRSSFYDCIFLLHLELQVDDAMSLSENSLGHVFVLFIVKSKLNTRYNISIRKAKRIMAEVLSGDDQISSGPRLIKN